MPFEIVRNDITNIQVDAIEGDCDTLTCIAGSMFYGVPEELNQASRDGCPWT